MTVIQVRYVAQLRRVAGRSEEEIPVDDAPALLDLLHLLARRHGDSLRNFLLDPDGAPRPSLVVAIGDRQTPRGANPPLRPGDVVTLLAPMAGG